MIDKKDKFYIKKVIIKNFRGYKGETIFKFEKENQIPKLILLTGPNGYGKTSLIDAIEWCFTGEISRLKKSLSTRVNSTDKNNKKNNIGLIKNINSEDDLVEVKIYANYNGGDVCISRKFEGDSLENDCINGLNSEIIVKYDNGMECNELKEKLSSFNDDNLCSYDKNIDLYNQSRGDIYKIFSHLYSDEYKINTIIENLDIAKDTLDKKCKSLNGEIEDIKGKINLYTETKKNYDISTNISVYPESKVFDKEIILNNVDDINIKDVESQIKILSDMRNAELYSELENIKAVLDKNLEKSKKEELIKLLKDNKETYIKLKDISFEDINKQKKELISLKRFIKNIDSYKGLIENKAYKNTIDKIPESIQKSIKSLYDITKKIEELESKIEVYSEKNPTVKVLRYIVDNTKELDDYRQDYNQCPICGSSDIFKQAEIGKIAKKILGENDIERQNIQSEIKLLRGKEIDVIKEIKKTTIDYADKNIETLEDNLKKENDINHINHLFKELHQTYDENSIIKLNQEINEYNIRHIEKEECNLIDYILLKKYPFFNDINEHLDYEKYKNLKISEKVKIIDIIMSRLKINLKEAKNNIRTNKEELDSRISICNSYINILNKDNLTRKIEDCEKIKIKKTAELNLLGKKLENIKDMTSKMNSLKTKDEKQQTDKIQKPLDNIYRKITRNTNIKKIELIRAKANNSCELDIVDFNDKKTSFANILSAGQLSTLAISIFLAKASLKDEDSIKLYLMDEPIQTMDNLNILSFIDLIKYQLKKDSNKSFIDQIIFSTCDENLSRLFTYKLNSFNIPICEYKFNGNSSPTQL